MQLEWRAIVSATGWNEISSDGNGAVPFYEYLPAAPTKVCLTKLIHRRSDYFPDSSTSNLEYTHLARFVARNKAVVEANILHPSNFGGLPFISQAVEGLPTAQK